MTNTRKDDYVWVFALIMCIIAAGTVGLIINITNPSICEETVVAKGSPSILLEGHLQTFADNGYSNVSLDLQKVDTKLQDGNIEIKTQRFCRDNWMVAFIDWNKVKNKLFGY